MARPMYKPNLKHNRVLKRKKVVTPTIRTVKAKRKKKRVSPLQFLVLTCFVVVLAMKVLPYVFTHFTKHVFLGHSYPEISVDYNKLYKPTSKYLYNNHFLGVNSLISAQTKKPVMQTLYEAGEIPALKARLRGLMKLYPNIDPAIYVWDFATGNSIDIKANEQYPAASIIKIPILLELFRSIEVGQFDLYDKMKFTNYYRTSGSGALQYTQANVDYSMNHLAKIMITNSDNTATNMVVSKIGGMNDVNRAIKRWGLKNTYINKWLPDLKGSNYTSAKDIAVMLYNIDNSSFLSLKSRESIVEYMGHVRNNRLLQAGLPKDAVIMHKTGDIGKMLGDAGIVWTNQGKKYIVVILAKRPFNSYSAKEFITKASSIIYDGISRHSY